MESDAASAVPAESRRCGRGWLSGLESRPLLGVGFAVSAALTAAAVGLGSSPSLVGTARAGQPAGADRCSASTSSLIVALGVLIGRRVLRLVGPADRRRRRAAAPALRRPVRRRRRAPALIVAFFFGVLVTRGVDNWFSARVADRGRELGHGRRLLHRRAARLHQRPRPPAWPATSTSAGRRRWPTRRSPSRSSWRPAGRRQRLLRRLRPRPRGPGAGHAPSGRTRPAFLAPPPPTFRVADAGRRCRVGAVRINRPVPRALSAARLSRRLSLRGAAGRARHLRATCARPRPRWPPIARPRPTAPRSRRRFASIYLETVLLVLLGAVWFGMAAAGSIAGAGGAAGAGRRPGRRRRPHGARRHRQRILRRSPDFPAPSTA